MSCQNVVLHQSRTAFVVLRQSRTVVGGSSNRLSTCYCWGRMVGLYWSRGVVV